MPITVALEWHEEYDELKRRAIKSAMAAGIKVGGASLLSEVWTVGDLNIQIMISKHRSRLPPQFEYFQGRWICNGRMIGYNHLRGKLRALHQDPK